MWLDRLRCHFERGSPRHPCRVPVICPQVNPRAGPWSDPRSDRRSYPKNARSLRPNPHASTRRTTTGSPFCAPLAAAGLPLVSREVCRRCCIGGM